MVNISDKSNSQKSGEIDYDVSERDYIARELKEKYTESADGRYSWTYAEWLHDAYGDEVVDNKEKYKEAKNLLRKNDVEVVEYSEEDGRDGYTSNNTIYINNYYKPSEATKELTYIHERHHILNKSREIYGLSSDGSSLGAEAYARIDRADEIGARMAEIAHVRNIYIKAGGGEKGLVEIQKYADCSWFIADYVNDIKNGKVNPLSKKKEDIEQDMQTMFLRAKQDLDYSNHYHKQYRAFALNRTKDYNLENVKINEKEVQKRCNLAMTVPMLINGRIHNLNYSQKVELPKSEYNSLYKIMDDHPDWVIECIENKKSFDEATAQMSEINKRNAIAKALEGAPSLYNPYDEEVFDLAEYNAKNDIKNGISRVSKTKKLDPSQNADFGYYDYGTGKTYVLNSNSELKKQIYRDAWKSSNLGADIFGRTAEGIQAVKDNKDYLKYVKSEERQELTIVNAEHRKKTVANGAFSMKDGKWPGCLAFAEIAQADEIGSRLEELNHIRDVYINAGGGEKGIKEIEKFTKHYKYPLHDKYISAIKSGEINPLSSDKDAFAKETSFMRSLAYKDLCAKDEFAGTYAEQHKTLALKYAASYGTDKIEIDKAETQRRCDIATTISMTVDGQKKDIVFHIKPEAAGYEKELSAIDNNSDLVREYYENGSKLYAEKTQKMRASIEKNNAAKAYMGSLKQNKISR